MSATVPATSANSTAGRLFAVCTSASRVEESETEAITVTAPDGVHPDHELRARERAPHAAKPALTQRRERRVARRRLPAGCRRAAGQGQFWDRAPANVCIICAMATPNLRGGSRATLRDVARKAGVHPATASRALNDDTRALVNEETAEARPPGRRGARLPTEPDRARPEDQPLLHDRGADPGPHQPAVPADPAGDRGPPRGGRLHAADREHRQRPRARAGGHPGHARTAGGGNHHRHGPARPRRARRRDGGGARGRARQPLAAGRPDQRRHRRRPQGPAHGDRASGRSRPSPHRPPRGAARLLDGHRPP